MSKKKDDKKTTTIDDWMVRVSFAEPGEPDAGFKPTGEDIVRKTKLALDRMMVEKSVKKSMQTNGSERDATSPGSNCRITPS